MTNPNSRPPPAFVRRIVLAMSFLAGPVLLIGTGAELLRRSRTMNESATATVVEVRPRNAHETVLYCAVYRWQHGAETIEAEAAECVRATERPSVGDQVQIRYADDDVQTPYEDNWWRLYGVLAVPAGIAGLLFSALFAFLLLPRRS